MNFFAMETLKNSRDCILSPSSISWRFSFHATFDHCTVGYLRRAGVAAEHMRLADIGIRGNAHMMMLELNNTLIAEAIFGWLLETGLLS